MPKLRFNHVRVDVGARQVFRGAEPVHLTRKAFDLLVLLIDAFNVDVEDVEQDADLVAEQRAVRAWLVGKLSRIPLYAGENILGRDDGVTKDWLVD